MLYSLLAGIILALQFSATKLYQVRRGVAMTTSLAYSCLSGFCTAAIFFVVNGFQMEITPFSVVMGLGSAIFSMAYTLMGFRLMAMGAMAVYTLFLMLGTMIMPYLYGILLLGEEMKALQMVGVAIIALGLVLQCRDGSVGQRLEKKNMTLFALLCVLVFFCNGMVGIVTKTHQVADRYPIVDSISFVVLGNLLSSAVAAVLLLALKMKKGGKSREQANPGDSGLLKNLWIIVVFAILNGVSYWCILLAAERAPASALYPVLTGSSVVLSAVAAWVFFKEKPSRVFMTALLIAAVGTVLFAF